MIYLFLSSLHSNAGLVHTDDRQALLEIAKQLHTDLEQGDKLSVSRHRGTVIRSPLCTNLHIITPIK